MRSPIVLALGLLLVGCGIDRGGAPDLTLTPVSAIRSADSLVVGPIDDKSTDSLTIDGVTINVANAQFQLDGSASALDLVQVGQYAVVRGETTVESGMQARTVTVDTEVIGPATAFDPVSQTLVVLGQQVIISDTTVLASTLVDTVFADVDSLGPIRVSGIANGLGQIHATYVAPEPVAAFRLTGFATVIDDANLNFQIGQQTITYANAIMFDLASTAPAQYERVALTGQTQATTFTVNTIVGAPLVPDDLESNAPVQLTAAVTASLANAAFSVAFVPATLAANASFTAGSASDIVAGALVTVQGVWNDDGLVDVTAVHVVRPQLASGTKK